MEKHKTACLQSGKDEGMKMYNCPRWEKSTVYPVRICNRSV